jgi:hypothetical protein
MITYINAKEGIDDSLEVVRVLSRDAGVRSSVDLSLDRLVVA